MAWFTLTEKLVITGAFLAIVALAVGTEDDPGLVVTGQETVKELRPVAAPAPLAEAAPQSEVEAPQPSNADIPLPQAAVTTAPQPEVASDDDDDDQAFSPELGRVPLDFSKGPPPG